MREPVPDDERPVVDTGGPPTDDVAPGPDDERPVTPARGDPEAPVPDEERPVPAATEGVDEADDLP